MKFNFERWGVWIDDCGVIPHGYGVAWYSAWSMRAFCMRVPFNRIVGSFRAFYLELQRPCEDDPVLAAFLHGESLGFAKGNEHGYTVGLKHAEIVREVMR